MAMSFSVTTSINGSDDKGNPLSQAVASLQKSLAISLSTGRFWRHMVTVPAGGSIITHLTALPDVFHRSGMIAAPKFILFVNLSTSTSVIIGGAVGSPHPWQTTVDAGLILAPSGTFMMMTSHEHGICDEADWNDTIELTNNGPVNADVEIILAGDIL